MEAAGEEKVACIVEDHGLNMRKVQLKWQLKGGGRGEGRRVRKKKGFRTRGEVLSGQGQTERDTGVHSNRFSSTEKTERARSGLWCMSVAVRV